MSTAIASFPTIFRRSVWVDLTFWLVYGTFWHLVFAPERFTVANLLISGLLTFWQAVATYAHIRWLLEPRLQKQLSTWRYCLVLPPLLLAISLLSWTSVYAFMTKVLGAGFGAGFWQAALEYWAGSILGGMGMAVAFTGAIYLFYRRREQEKREQELEKARVQTELAYLRGQLNPHFLFNALNSIYFLIPKSPEDAQEALGGFSDLLRYQLYQTDGGLVPLAEELEQLNKYVELNRLRLEEDFVVGLRFPPELRGIQVPPLLLLPLMENAFKYSPATGGEVTGLAEITAGRLLFTLTNKVGEAVTVPTAEAASQAGGIGLTNIRRRLSILFPNDHSLVTHQRGDYYTVNLEIPVQA